MLDRLRRLVRPGTGCVFRECRHCGTTVGSAGTCPACGSAEIARYRL